MRILLLFLICLGVMSSVYASDSSKLRMRIAGQITDSHFICLSQVGCVSIKDGNSGRVFPMNNGGIGKIVTVNLDTREMFPQVTPSSCNRSVDANQTLTITGNLGKRGNKLIIHNMNCSVG